MIFLGVHEKRFLSMQQIQSKVIFNFLPVRAGGGLQNSLSFLTSLASDTNFNLNYIILCWADGEIELLCKERKLPYKSMPYSVLNRVAFELFGSSKVIESSDVVFTLFGPPLLRKRKAVRINGCAYSNLFYPELNFWGFLKGGPLLLKRLIDVYRKRSLSNCDVIIFETAALLERAKNDLAFTGKDLRLVQMSPSILVDENNVESTVFDSFKLRIDNDEHISILYLSGPHPNKRHVLLARIIKELNSLGGKYQLVTTLPTGCYLEDLKAEFESCGIYSKLINLGPVNPKDVSSLISAVDCVCNIALLESFSNNFVEAWRMKKPLIVTDADWSRACCGDAAVYIDPCNSEESALLVRDTLSNSVSLDALVNSGIVQLERLPSRKERYNIYKKIILEYSK